MDTIRKLVKPGAAIQGGAFRLDKGPTMTEIHTFKMAITLHEGCMKDGKETRLVCIIDDLALKPGERPKATGIITLPDEYIRLLQEAHIPLDSVMIFYESTLRNKVTSDKKRRGLEVATKINGTTGFDVPICASIMGRFYTELAELGIPMQIGFYATRESSEDDSACPWGPMKGAMESESGYGLKLEVLNFMVRLDLFISSPRLFVPGMEPVSIMGSMEELTKRLEG